MHDRTRPDDRAAQNCESLNREGLTDWPVYLHHHIAPGQGASWATQVCEGGQSGDEITGFSNKSEGVAG